MELKHVDIYITHNVKGFKSRHGVYGYTLVYITAKGEARTLVDYGAVGETTQNCIILEALEKALGRLNTACEVTVYEDSKYIANVFDFNYMARWQANDYRNAKGGKIVDADKWHRIALLSRTHVIKAEYFTHHRFTDSMQQEINRRSMA